MKKVIRIISLLVLMSIVFTSSAVGALAATANVIFENKAEKFIFLPGSEYTETDLFDNFKNMMPGDTRTQTVVVRNNYPGFDNIKVYLRAIPHGKVNVLSENVAVSETVESMEDFLSQLSMVVRLDGKVVYSASPDELDGLKSNILLGTLDYRDTVKFDIELTMPIDIGNEYSGRIGEVDWVFTVEELEDPVVIPYYGRATITAAKLLNDAKPDTNEYKFQLTDANGNVLQTVNNRGSNVIFNSITYWTPGTYTYYLTEVAGNDPEITYDNTVYTITVKVTNMVSYFHTDITYHKNGIPYRGMPVFNNIKKVEEPEEPEKPEEPEAPDPVYVSLIATKTFNKHVAQGSDFTFNLLNGEQKAIQVKNNTDGYVIFDRLKFDSEGVYTYYMMEHKGDVEDMVYDTAIYEVTVRVFEKEGKLEAEVTYERNGEEYNDTPAFVNRTVEDPEIPETSDATTYIYVIIAIVSVAAVTAILLISKKKKN